MQSDSTEEEIMTDKKITLKYFLAVTVAVIFTWLIHEYAHWLMARLLGYETTKRINGTSYLENENPTELHRNIVSVAGPLITVLQGIATFLYLKYKGWNKYLYPLVVVAFYMRMLAGLMNCKMLNDEGRISEHLGIGTFTLSIIISAFLLYLVIKISKTHQLTKQFQIATTLIVMLTSSNFDNCRYVLRDQNYIIPSNNPKYKHRHHLHE